MMRAQSEISDAIPLRLTQFSATQKLLASCFLITLGIGYIVSLVNLDYQYSMMDGQPGLTAEDMKRAFYGDRTTTRLAAKINGGSMEQYLANPGDKNKILNWIQDGSPENQFETSVKPILKMNCMRCHSPNGLMAQRPLTKYSEVSAVVAVDRGEPPALWAREAHTHIFSIGIILFLLGGVFTLTSVSDTMKKYAVAAPFVGLVADFGSRFLAKYDADLVYVMMGTGAVLGLSMAILILVPLYEMWLKKAQS